MKNTLAFLAGVLTVVFFFWVGGFDFDERGEVALICAWLSLGSGTIFVCLYNLWQLEK